MKGSEISLTPKEFDILYFLAKNRGEVFTKNRLPLQYGRKIIFWITVTSWLLSGNCEKRLNLPGFSHIHFNNLGDWLQI